MRGTLAGKVRQEKYPFASCRGVLRLDDQQLIRIDSFTFRLFDFLPTQMISEPLKRSTCCQHTPEDTPFAFYSMTHRMNPSLWVELRLIGIGENHSGCSECR